MRSLNNEYKNYFKEHQSIQDFLQLIRVKKEKPSNDINSLADLMPYIMTDHQPVSNHQSTYEGCGNLELMIKKHQLTATIESGSSLKIEPNYFDDYQEQLSDLVHYTNYFQMPKKNQITFKNGSTIQCLTVDEGVIYE